MLGEHDVAGAIPVIPTSYWRRHRSVERDTILRRSSAEVRFLSMAPAGRSSCVTDLYSFPRSSSLSPVIRRRLGRLWRPKPGSSVRFTGGVPKFFGV